MITSDNPNYRLVAVRGDERFRPEDSNVIRTEEERVALIEACGAVHAEALAELAIGEQPAWAVALKASNPEQ